MYHTVPSLEPNCRELACKCANFIAELHKLGKILRTLLKCGLKVLELGSRLLVDLLGNLHGAIEEDSHLLEVLLREAPVFRVQVPVSDGCGEEGKYTIYGTCD